MSIQFTKMHALGNDFVVFDTVRQSVAITPDFIRFLSDRHRGVGCDQVLVLSPATDSKADFVYRIFNADGNEVFQCGNGARCMGLFVQEEKLSDKKTICMQTRRDFIHVTCLSQDSAEADIAVPNFTPASLPFCTTELSAPYHLFLKNRTIAFDVVSVGNPHCVIVANDISDAIANEVGVELNAHPAFPEGVNVGFVSVESRDVIRLTVYERGAGLTQACGSGACAAVAVGQRQGNLNAVVTVHQRGGTLQVATDPVSCMLQLRGPVTRVFRGAI